MNSGHQQFSKRAVVVLKGKAFQQTMKQNNYRVPENNHETNNHFGPTTSPGKPTNKPTRKPSSQQVRPNKEDAQQANKLQSQQTNNQQDQLFQKKEAGGKGEALRSITNVMSKQGN